MGVPYFLKLKTIIHDLICVKIVFNKQPSKMKIEPSQFPIFDKAHRIKDSINLKSMTKTNRRLSELCPYDITSSLDKIEEILC